MKSKYPELSPERFLDKNPELLKLTPNILKQISIDSFDIKLDFHKTWAENGFGELDTIEFLLECEKSLLINISDEIADDLFGLNVKPPIFIQHIRQQKLKELGIE
jgi:hypothetical protein